MLNNLENISDLVFKLKTCLSADGISLDGSHVELLQRHVDLVRQWNPIVGVVATRDVDALWERHVADSLSLASVIVRLRLESAHLYDVGSGGGFPGIPIKVLFPQLRVTLLERSVRKAGFLRKVVAALELQDTTVYSGELSQFGSFESPCAVVSRAVENPKRVSSEILEWLDHGSVFLSQSGLVFGGDADTERVIDRWTEAGLRRGTLDLVRRR